MPENDFLKWRIFYGRFGTLALLFCVFAKILSPHCCFVSYYKKKKRDEFVLTMIMFSIIRCKPLLCYIQLSTPPPLLLVYPRGRQNCDFTSSKTRCLSLGRRQMRWQIHVINWNDVSGLVLRNKDFFPDPVA